MLLTSSNLHHMNQYKGEITAICNNRVIIDRKLESLAHPKPFRFSSSLSIYIYNYRSLELVTFETSTDGIKAKTKSTPRRPTGSSNNMDGGGGNGGSTSGSINNDTARSNNNRQDSTPK